MKDKAKAKRRVYPRRAGLWLHFFLFLLGQITLLSQFTLATDGLWVYSLVWALILYVHFLYPRIARYFSKESWVEKRHELRHFLGDILAGAYTAWIGIISAAVVRTFQQGWFDDPTRAQNENLFLQLALWVLIPGIIYGFYRWSIHLRDERDNLRETLQNIESASHETYPDASRLLDIVSNDEIIDEAEDIPLQNGRFQ